MPTTNGIWPSYAGGPQHQGLSRYRAQHLGRILWSTPVDEQPQYSFGDLLIHYGSPLITSRNTVVVPVKTGATDGFRVDGYRASDGLRTWSMTTDYVLPAHDWTPALGPAIVGKSQLAVPGIGGTVYVRSNTEVGAAAIRQLCFFGINKYRQNRTWCNLNVKICTPITTDIAGNMWFGFRISGTPPATMPQLKSGLARVSLNGTGTWISAANMAGGDSTYVSVPIGCTPALSPDGTIVYVAVKQSGFGGRLVGVDPQNLQPVYLSAPLTDPKSNQPSRIDDSSTASPTVGPDGHVFYGVLENPSLSNDDRGWLFHFDGTLTPVLGPLLSNIVGAFGWDDTVSIVPRYCVPSYQGTSQYLIFTKYNNYAISASPAGNGLNGIAVLDPNDQQPSELYSQTATMAEVMLPVLGQTIDSNAVGVFPGARREWCINAAAVDPFSRSVLVNSEDGWLYRWDLTVPLPDPNDNLPMPDPRLVERIQLAGPLGEAYTPTVVGMNGTVYAINNATLFAIGNSVAP